MPRNVEIKARITDLDAVVNSIKNLCHKEPVVLIQEDSFFVTPKGRLKLRNFQDGAKSQLIFYNRVDTEGPKLSTYTICNVDNPAELFSVLNSALGCIGTVKKTRQLFLYEQTRIHVDKVENLGDFVELEVVLTPNQGIDEGEQIAHNLMKQLQVTDENLIKGAYIDLLQGKKLNCCN